MTAYLAEFMGTFLVILLGNGVVANVVLNKTKGQNSGWMVITMGWAMAVFVGVYVSADKSGAHLNPAVTLALTAVGDFPMHKAVFYILAQFAGAMVASFVVWLSYRQHFDATTDAELKLAVFCTAPAIRSKTNNFITEMIGAFVLVFAALNLKSGDTTYLGSLNALPIALVVLAIGLSLGGPTGYAINPARDLGPRLMHAILPISNKRDSDWGYAWLPVVAPIAGGVLAAVLMKAI
jgi:glycerol uptake facilitator protein